MAAEVSQAYLSPSGGGAVEAGLARELTKRGLIVGPLIIVVFGLLRGPLGAVAAAIGVAVVVANFLVMGYLLSRAAAVSLQLYHAATLVGFVVRLALITGTMFAIAWLFEVDRIALGIAAVTAYLVLLTLEAMAVLRRDGIGEA